MQLQLGIVKTKDVTSLTCHMICEHAEKLSAAVALCKVDNMWVLLNEIIMMESKLYLSCCFNYNTLTDTIIFFFVMDQMYQFTQQY